MTDSNLYSICGFSPWQLDLIDPEWAGERLPVEEILVLASSSTIELQSVMGSDGNEVFSERNGGLGQAPDGTNKWFDNGDDMKQLPIYTAIEEDFILEDEEGGGGGGGGEGGGGGGGGGG
jgi:hypothetical protein